MGRLVLFLVVIFSAISAMANVRPVVPDASAVRLDEIGLYRVGYRLDGAGETLLPTGWSGHFVEPSGVSCTPFGVQDGRPAFLLHCPWRKGTGTVFQEFAFVVPRSSGIRLAGWTAMRSDAVGKSDGATFRILVNGKKLLERAQTDANWMSYSISLPSTPGKTLVVRFETDPGARRDASFDFSLWADRTITFVGYKPAVVTRPSPPPLDLSRLVQRDRMTVVPPNAYNGQTAIEVKDGKARLSYRGRDGTIEYLWHPAEGDLGRFEVISRMGGDRAHRLFPCNAARIAWAREAIRTSWTVGKLANAARSVRKYRVGDVAATLTMDVSIQGKALVMDIRCDRGVIESLDFGGWGPTARRRSISVPYYGEVAHAVHEGLFLNAFLDWTTSSATYHSSVTAHYAPLTDGRRNPLRERAVFVPGRHLAETLPAIPNPPSPYRADVGRRIVLDVWGGRYRDIADKLQTLHDYGLRDCIVLIHDWQRSGYDNALPMHLPAAADKGGDPDMRHLVRTAVSLGYRIALHENYVDYYPNYDHFDENHIALEPSGSKKPAWYNPGTKIQSFAVKPNAILPLAELQSPEIHRRFGTNACYLDVHSAVPPWFHVDHRAGEEGAGTFARVRDIHAQLFAYERKIHGGPVFGEGNAHWYWSGLLDGVEAQFGTGWPANAGQTAPLMPVFNLLKVHPLQINHGQGYYERWWQNLPWGSIPTMDTLDQYRMQEVVFGHAGFLGASAWDLIPAAWLEHHLLTPVTSRHSVSTVRSITYFVKGRWVDSTTAAAAGDWSRPRIEYANGLTIIANDGPETWRVHGVTLPRHGWIARGAGVTAYTAIRDDVVCDYAETADSVFANARPAQHWNIGNRLRVRPRVAEFSQTAPRRFRVTYAWDTQGVVHDDYVAFVHFSQPTTQEYDEGIRFQQDHSLPTPSSTWRRGTTITDGPYEVTIPDNIADGTYTWTIGLYKPAGRRAILEGPTDRSGRTVLGELRVSANGSKLEFIPRQSSEAAPKTPVVSRLNAEHRVVSFSSVRTDGSVNLQREGPDWVMRTWPRDVSFTVELNAHRFPVPDRVLCDGAGPQEARISREGNWWRLEPNGAKAYRWRAPSVPSADSR